MLCGAWIQARIARFPRETQTALSRFWSNELRPHKLAVTGDTKLHKAALLNWVEIVKIATIH